ncbi:ribonuclease P protein component [Salidesulfovibrio onnuriiensis]|uniref:ribonuclease P protein component n=1 Tax=Salidesulfovibrio onnuriiensis TaxID=2583823 RepID=UPI0011C93267|nr:ribonuclease P protein component [Salidesulfovibrio onnuriiensis]
MSRLTWPKERRLLRRPEFTACFERGVKFHSRFFIVFALKREDTRSGFKLGLVVSRKVGPAVVRNRVKRVVREYFRLHQNELDLPLDMAIVPKRKLDPRQLDLALADEEFTPMLSRIRGTMTADSVERT